MQTVLGRTVEEIAALIAKEAEMCRPADKLDMILTELKIMSSLLEQSLKEQSLKERPETQMDQFNRRNKIMAVQKAIGVFADGVPGPTTWRALKSLGL